MCTIIIKHKQPKRKKEKKREKTRSWIKLLIEMKIYLNNVYNSCNIAIEEFSIQMLGLARIWYIVTTVYEKLDQTSHS